MFDDDSQLVTDVPSTIISPQDFYQNSLHPRPLRRRWYILTVFSLLAFTQGLIRETWRYVLKPQKVVHGLTMDLLLLLLSWSPILIILCCMIMGKLLVRYGLRVCTVHCAFVLAFGAGIRCIPAPDPWALIAANWCAILTGYCGSLTMIAATTLSVIWFPITQRVTATALVTVAGRSASDGIYFLVSRFWISKMYTFMLPLSFFLNINETVINDSSYNSTNASLLFDQAMDQSIHGLTNFMGVEFLLCILIFAACAICFPRLPTIPANFSSTVVRQTFSLQIKALIRIKNFWLVIVACAIPIGAAQALQQVAPLLMSYNGYQPELIQWLEFFTHMGGLIGCIGIGRVADFVMGQLKTIFGITMIWSFIGFLWFAFMCLETFSNNTTCAYISFVIGTMGICCATPIALELVSEISYPVSEFIPSAALIATSCFIMLILKNLIVVVHAGWNWILFLVPALCLLSLLPLFYVQPVYRRLRIDLQTPESPAVSSDDEHSD